MAKVRRDELTSDLYQVDHLVAGVAGVSNFAVMNIGPIDIPHEDQLVKIYDANIITYNEAVSLLVQKWRREC